MKKIKIIYNIILMSALMLTNFGCVDVMEKTNLSQLLAEDVWEDPALIKKYMDQIVMDNVPAEQLGNFGATEEFFRETGEWKFKSDGFGVTDGMAWSYGGVRSINKFLENVDRCPSDKLSDELKTQYKAQLLTLRGWLYFNMVRMYGGVPLILHEQQADDDDLYVSRAKTSECIEQIVQDFDDAIATESFPMRWDAEAEAGRISKALAYALRGRVLLYYASPQFSKTIGAGTKDADTRWSEAYAACKEAKDLLAAAGYGLFKPEPVDFDDAEKTFYELFYTEIPVNPEVIGVRRNKYQAYINSTYDQLVRPTPSGGFKDNADASLEYANAFLNADGSPFTRLEIPSGHETSASLARSTTDYWTGREPRFYASIAYNGCIWPLFRNGAFANDTDEDGKMRHQWVIEGLNDNPFQNLTTINGSIKIRKMIDVSQRYFGAEGNRYEMDWILCRYAEVLLNFAETAVKTGHEGEAMEVLQTIRRRAGIPQGDNNYGLGSASGDNLLVLILKERLLELSQEGDGFRFYDLRRWRLYTEDIAGYTVKNLVRHTIRPRFKPNDDGTPAGTPDQTMLNRMAALDIRNNPASYFDMFEDHIYALDGERFDVKEREYFFHIAFGHILKNPNLEQTQGWESGTFNPYE